MFSRNMPITPPVAFAGSPLRGARGIEGGPRHGNARYVVPVVLIREAEALVMGEPSAAVRVFRVPNFYIIVVYVIPLNFNG